MKEPKCQYKQVSYCSDCSYKMCLLVNNTYYSIYQGYTAVSQNPFDCMNPQRGTDCRIPEFIPSSLAELNKKCIFFFGRELQSEIINLSEKGIPYEQLSIQT